MPKERSGTGNDRVEAERIGPVAGQGSIRGTGQTRKSVVDLNFKVPREFRRRFKRLAVDADLKNVELLKLAIEGYEREQGKATDTTRQRRSE